MDINHEFEETLKRIQSHRGVVGVIVINDNGDIITSTLDNRSSESHAKMINTLVKSAIGFVRNVVPTNDLTVLRMGTKRKEILVAPGKDFIMLVIQKQNLNSLLRSIENSLC